MFSLLKWCGKSRLPSHLPVTSCEPQSDNTTSASSNNEVKEALDTDRVTQLYLKLSQDLQLDYAAYTAPASR
jgi:hypothetical protein